MDYERLSAEQLANEVARYLGLRKDEAEAAIASHNPDLGRPWAVRLLTERDQYERRRRSIHESLERISAFVAR